LTSFHHGSPSGRWTIGPLTAAVQRRSLTSWTCSINRSVWRFTYLLLSWLYSPTWTFSSLMDLIQSSLFFDLCSQFLILHFLISPYTQSHHLYWVYLFADFLEVD
jgi:hypothetical protein